MVLEFGLAFDYLGDSLDKVAQGQVSKSLEYHIDTSIDKVVHLKGKCLFKFEHIATLACLGDLKIFCQLVLSKKLLGWKNVEVHLNGDQEF